MPSVEELSDNFMAPASLVSDLFQKLEKAGYTVLTENSEREIYAPARALDNVRVIGRHQGHQPVDGVNRVFREFAEKYGFLDKLFAELGKASAGSEANLTLLECARQYPGLRPGGRPCGVPAGGRRDRGRGLAAGGWVRGAEHAAEEVVQGLGEFQGPGLQPNPGPSTTFCQRLPSSVVTTVISQSRERVLEDHLRPSGMVGRRHDQAVSPVFRPGVCGALRPPRPC